MKTLDEMAEEYAEGWCSAIEFIKSELKRNLMLDMDGAILIFFEVLIITCGLNWSKFSDY